jgi:predicted MFS family arabinose efflux permease
MRRDRTTWLLYLATSCWGWTIYAFGPSTPLLGQAAGYSAAVIGLHGTALALGALTSGLIQARAVARLTRSGVLAAGAIGLSVGILLITGGNALVLTLLGSWAAGLGGTLVVNAASAALAQHHGRRGATALAEANAMAASLGALAPLVIAGAVAVGIGWQAGLLLVLPAIATLAVVFRGTPVPDQERASDQVRPPRLGRPFWWAWVAFVVLISVEFCFSIWGSVLVADRSGLDLEQATGTLTLFVLGIGVGRVIGARLASTLPNAPLLMAAIALALAGWLVVWTSTSLLVGAVGMLLAGLGVSLHFPLGLSRLLVLAPGQGDRAAGVGAVGTGATIAVAPFLLGWLSDAVGIHQAFLVVPAMLAVAGVSLAASVASIRLRHNLTRP